MDNPNLAVFYEFTFHDLNEEDQEEWQEKYGRRNPMIEWQGYRNTDYKEWSTENKRLAEEALRR
jgi:hypothetical protein